MSEQEPRAPDRSSAGRIWPLRMAVCLLAVLWIGNECRGRFPRSDRAGWTVERLIDSLPNARLLHDTAEIDLGPPLPRGTLVRGWSWNELWPGGGGGNWAVESQAEIAFPLVTLADREITLWMGGIADNGPLQQVTIGFNGRQTASFSLDLALKPYTFSVPRSAQRKGANRLVFAFDRLSSPIEGRRLAAVVDKVLIKPGSDSARAQIRPTQLGWSDVSVEPGDTGASPRGLAQPAASQLELGVLARGGAELHLAASSTSATRASIHACQDSSQGERCRELIRVSETDGSEAIGSELVIPLPELAAAPIVIRFDVERVPGPAGEAWPRHTWLEPRIVSPGPSQGFHLESLMSEVPRRAASEPALPLTAAEPALPQSPAIRHVLVYLIDTLRADLLVDPALDLPNLQRILHRSVWFTQAQSTSAWTKPATGSLFTSLEPSAHAAVGRTSALRQDVPSLAAWLGEHGVVSGAVVANGNVAAEFGFSRGFRRYRHVYDFAPAVHRVALEWLRDTRNERTFTYLHVLDPHYPYAPPPPWSQLLDLRLYTGPLDGSNESLQGLRHELIQASPEDRRHIKSLYQVKVRQLDAAFGDLLDGLGELELLDSTAIFLVSDHGEEFGEHGSWLHGSNLEPAQTDILLALHLPGQDTGTLNPSLASLLDVAPTICSLFGLPAPPEFRGVSLGSARPAARPLLLELEVDEFERLGLTGHDWAFSFSPGVNYDPHLYARLGDPGHQRNLASRFPVATRALEAWCLASRPAPSPSQPRSVHPDELPPETLEQLRAMGYIGR